MKDTIIHHLLCIGGGVMVCYQNMGAAVAVQGLFLAEVADPAKNLRVMLRNLGKRYTRIYEVVEYVYFFLYIFFRAFIGLPVYATVTCARVGIVPKIAAVGILMQSCMFASRMLPISMNRIKETRERNSKGIKIDWLEPMSKKTLEDCAFYQKSQKRNIVG
jgi:hypothetical protein